MISNSAMLQGESEGDTMTPFGTSAVSDALPLSLEGEQGDVIESEMTTGQESEPEHQQQKVGYFSCQGTRFWKSAYDAVSCAMCHPPADPSLVGEWIEIS